MKKSCKDTDVTKITKLLILYKIFYIELVVLLYMQINKKFVITVIFVIIHLSQYQKQNEVIEVFHCQMKKKPSNNQIQNPK